MKLLFKSYEGLSSEYKKDAANPMYYLTYIYRQDFLKQLQNKMYDVEKYSGNDLEFCKSKILKMLDGKDDGNNNTGDDGNIVKDNSGDNKGVPHYELESFTADPNGVSGNLSNSEIKSVKITGKGCEVVVKNSKIELKLSGSITKEVKEGGSTELSISLKMTGNDNDVKAVIVVGGMSLENELWVGKSKVNNYDRKEDKQTLSIKPVTKKSKGQVVEIYLNLSGYENPILLYKITYKFVNN